MSVKFHLKHFRNKNQIAERVRNKSVKFQLLISLIGVKLHGIIFHISEFSGIKSLIELAKTLMRLIT